MLIDGEWEDFFSERSTCVGSHGYAVTRGPDGGQVLVHRLIAGAQESTEIVDHLNHDPLDNRAANLRLGTRAANNANKLLPVTRGTTWCERTQKWMAQAKVQGKTHWLGRHADRRDAIRVAHEWRMKNMPGYEFSVDWEELAHAIA